MSFLEGLKRQAEALKETQAHDAARLRANAALVEKALARCFGYLDDLAKQLEVLKPRSPRRFFLDGVGEFENLVLTDFFADYRKKKFEEKDHFDYLTLQFKYVAEGQLIVNKDTPQLVQRCEEFLWRCNVKFTTNGVRNDRGFVTAAAFNIPRVIPATITVEGDYDNAKVVFALKNVERFEALKLSFDPAEFDNALLDDLAKLILAEPNRFRIRGEIIL
jgi:hypothetical protein